MSRVRFIRDTLAKESGAPILIGTILDLPEPSVARWLRRNAVELFDEVAATSAQSSKTTPAVDAGERKPKPKEKQ